MGYESRSKSASALSLHRLLASLSPEWVAYLINLSHRLFKMLLRNQPDGMYEFLLYDATLELLDAKGKTAIFRKHQRVKFLQDHIIAFEDYAWGEGDIFASYKISPGVEADRYQEADRWNLLISLRETKQRGDIEDFHIERMVKNGFTAAEEWQQAEIRHWTRSLKLAVIFPAERPCLHATLRMRQQKRVIVLGKEHFHPLPDGRQMVRWEAKNIRPLEIFTLRWRW